ncbi:MAG: GNAT family N-acetyltransferase [Clostridiales bacterium]|nr:GNAT family N-acetyltransferase [Clostridiales bacterium]
MIRQARPTDLPQLITLWQEAFGESEADTRFYFEHRHADLNMLVHVDDQALTGMLSMLPIQLVTNGHALKARYVFAVATRLSHRNRGISSRLMEKAHEAMREEGSLAAVLVPADEGLFSYYERRGYETAFFVDQIDVTAAEVETWPVHGVIEASSALDYKRTRDQAFSDLPLLVQWDETALRYIKLGNERAGGSMIRLRYGDETACAVLEPRGDYLRITEFTGKKKHWQHALALIHQQMKADHYQMLLPADYPVIGKTRPFGMIHWLKTPPENASLPGYLAFAKD